MAPHSPFSFEDARHWPTLPAGGQIKHRPNSPGPWTVYFVVNGHGIFRKVDSDDGRVTLVETGGGFRVDIN